MSEIEIYKVGKSPARIFEREWRDVIYIGRG